MEEVMAHFGEKSREAARKDPEACLISMLTLIKEELPHTWATLRQSIQLTTYHCHLKEAREKLAQSE